MSTSQDNSVGVGVDIASRKFDVAFSDSSRVQTFDYDQKGIDAFIKLLNTKRAEGFRILCICLEATGQYQRRLVERLFAQRWPIDPEGHTEQPPVAVVNPRLPRQFAQAHNRLAPC